jgi:dTDP-L-rhamnose 4-epimerase
MTGKIILITGGAGFIGSHLARRLMAKGRRVRILDSLSPQIHGDPARGIEWLSAGGVEFLRGSVTSRTDWERALRGVDQVVHLAAETGTGQSMYEVGKYCMTNSQGTALMIDVLCNDPGRSARRVLLASSRAVYGEGTYSCPKCGGRINPGARAPERLRQGSWDPVCPACSRPMRAVPTSEDDPVAPASIYAATKHAQEDLVRIGCSAIGVGHLILRLQNVYGEGQSLNNPYTGILSIFSTRIRHGLELPIFEDGLESRDFVHVDDVAEAFVRGVDLDSAADGAVNVGTGRPTTVLELASVLAKALGGDARTRVTGEFRAGDIRHNFADTEKAKRLLGFRAGITLETGLGRFAEWVLAQPLPEDLLEKADRELRERRLMG